MDPEHLRSSHVFNHFQGFKIALNPYAIPPDRDLIDQFDKATRTGYVEDPGKGREPFSLLFLDNNPFSICSKSDKFSQMSIGYTMVFLYSKFSIWFSLYPLALYALALAVIYSVGNGCLYDATITTIIKEVQSVDQLNRLQELYPASPLPARLNAILSEPGQDQSFKKYRTWSCLILGNTSKCNALDALNCTTNYTETCEIATAEAFLETYINGICHNNVFSVVSASNYIEERRTDNLIGSLQGIVVILAFIMISIFYYVHQKKISKFQRYNATVENYSAMVCGLPSGLNANHMRNLVVGLFKEHALEVTSVNLIFDTREYLDLQDRANILMRSKAKELWKNGSASSQIVEEEELFNPSFTNPFGPSRFSPQIQSGYELQFSPRGMTDGKMENISLINQAISKEVDHYDTELNKINLEINSIATSYNQGAISNLFLGAAVISFMTEEELIKALSIFERSGLMYKTLGFGPIHTKVELILEDGLNSNQLWLEETFSPQDVLWQNLGYSRMNKFLRRLLAAIIALALVVLIFFGILWLKVKSLALSGNLDKNNNQQGNLFGWSLAANVIVGTVVLGIDYTLEFIFLMLGEKFEKASTITITEKNISQKTWMMQIVSSGLIPAAVGLVLLNFYGNGGMIYTIHLIFIANLIGTPFAILFGDVVWYWKKYQRHRIDKFISSKKSGKISTQEEANEVYLRLNFKLSYIYPLILKNIGLACFFSTIFPLGVFYCVLQMIIYYWCFKYILVSITNKVRQFSSRISHDLIVDFELCIVLLVLGMIYDNLVRDVMNGQSITVDPLHIVLLSVSVVLVYFQVTRVSTDCLREKSLSLLTYEQMKAGDPNSYHLANPATVKSIGQTSKQVGSKFNQLNLPIPRLRDLDEIEEQEDRNPRQMEESNRIYVSHYKDFSMSY